MDITIGTLRDAPVDVIALAVPNQEALEQFVLQKIEGGAPLRGTYPPNEETLAEYEAWKQRNQSG